MITKQLLSSLSSALMGLTACTMVSACGPTALSTSRQPAAPASSISAQAPAQLVAQLQQAKALDQAGLADSTVAIKRRGDFLEHEARADRVIHQLEHGIPVAQNDVNYALEVPPRHLESSQRTALIEQLKNAINEDERREQDVVAFGSNVFYEDPDAPSQFGSQEQLAQQEVQNLEAGNHVSWDDLQQALYVPPNPL